MFKFKGISSNDMNVVIEEEEHFLARASHKYNSISIEGRDGDIIETMGYSNVERPIKVQILNKDCLDDIFSWLNGTGQLQYKNRVTEAHFLRMIEPIRTSGIYIADFMFIRSPFWYKVDDEFIIAENVIFNEGNVYSKPIIRIEKGNENTCELSIAGIRFLYDFQDEEYVEIDCQEMFASYEKISRNRNLIIGYDYPILYPGENKIIIHSGDPIIKIKRKDCWL